MRKSLLLLSLILSLGASGSEKDLSVLIRPKTFAKSRVGEPIEMEIKMRNASTMAMSVIKPGDGSESRWREPYVYYSAQKLEGDEWREVPTRPILRCGLYNFNWQADVVTIEPGKSLALGDWVPGPQTFFELTPGRYRLQLHYDYAAGKNCKGEPGAPPQAMAGVAPFHLVSEPVEYTVLP